MGRKKAVPQPLSIPHTNLNITSKTTSSATTSIPSEPTAAAQAISAANSTLGTASSTSTSLSPSESRSPASASARISPFSSRFAQKRPQTARAGPPSKTNDFDQFDRRRPSQPSVQGPAQSQKAAAYPHIASAYNHSSTSVRSAQSTSQSRQPPTQGQQPPKQAQHEPKKSRGFFHFAKPSKSFTQSTSQPSHNSIPSRDEPQPAKLERADTSGSNKAGSTHRDAAHPQSSSGRPLHLKSSRSQHSLSSSHGERESPQAAPKRKPLGLLKRTKSLRDNLRDIANPSEQQHDPMPTLAPQSTNGSESPSVQAVPAQQHTERPRRDMMDSSIQNPSEDRVPPREGQTTREQRRDKSPKGASVPAPAPAPALAPAPVRENGHSTFFSGLKNSSSKAAGMFNRGFFKGHRSASTHEHQHSFDDEHYELKVLNLPLAAQTRKTRISKRLEDSRDKTEFWMPAFPWRAIDYLNFKGCEVEGLYRVPGSGPQIKKWQRRFDEEHDVNLFEAEDLYDINIIGSMLKAWLRELPEELFPKAAQERIARECAGSETVPQLLIDELSNLSPFQYYLLFAITCHLSLLLANSDKNKMDFRNLCICFQPCMKIDAFCFKFLVCDWRDCWKGCANEAAYIEQEYILLDEPPPQGLSQSAELPQTVTVPPAAATRRSRSESSQRSANGAAPARVPQQTQIQESQSKDSVGSNGSTISTTLTLNSEQDAAKSRSVELRRLSPIQPLSPLGFH